MKNGYLMTQDGVQLFYEVHGEGEQAVIAPAGMYLAPDFERLTQNRRWIFFHQRNRGASETTPPNQMGAKYELIDIDAVRQHFDLETFALFGWSYSGAIAALYAAIYPQDVTHLVMAGALPPRIHPYYEGGSPNEELARSRVGEDAQATVDKMRDEGIDESDPATFCREYRKVSVPRNMVNAAHMARSKTDVCQYANEHPDTVASRIPYLYESFGAWDWRAAADRIQCPALILHGEGDLIPPEGAKEWADHIDHAKLVMIPECAHYPWLETPELFFTEVDLFLPQG